RTSAIGVVSSSHRRIMSAALSPLAPRFGRSADSTLEIAPVALALMLSCLCKPIKPERFGAIGGHATVGPNSGEFGYIAVRLHREFDCIDTELTESPRARFLGDDNALVPRFPVPSHFAVNWPLCRMHV